MCRGMPWKKDKGNRGETRYNRDMNNVAPAWTKTTNEITCRNHEKESTTNTYLLCLQARIVEFRMASDMEMRWGCKVTQWKRKKIERQKQKVKSKTIFKKIGNNLVVHSSNEIVKETTRKVGEKSTNRIITCSNCRHGMGVPNGNPIWRCDWGAK